MLNEQLMDDIGKLINPISELKWKKYSEYPYPEHEAHIFLFHEDYPEIIVPALTYPNIPPNKWKRIAICLYDSSDIPWMNTGADSKIWWTEYKIKPIYDRLKIPLPTITNKN